MPRIRPRLVLARAVVSLLAGAALGLVILGFGGRLAMRLAALIAGLPPGFSWGGSLEVAVAGMWYGAVAGVVRIPFGVLKWYLSAPLVAATLFALISLGSDAARSAVSSLPSARRIPALSLMTSLLMIHAGCLCWALRHRANP